MNKEHKSKFAKKTKLKNPTDFYNTPLTNFAPAIAKSLGINLGSSLILQLDEYIEKEINAKIEKVIIYTPSAIGAALIDNYSEDFQKVRNIAPCQVELLSEYPQNDLNCLNAMYTIKRSDLQKSKKDKDFYTQSLFDLLQDKKCAAVVSKRLKPVSVFKSSNIDVFTESYDGEVISKSIQLIKENNYDLLVIINQEYKDMMHITNPYSKKALNAMRTHIAAFELLANATEVYMQNKNTLIVFAPEHGAHRSLLGFGTYGKYIPEDMNLLHFYGILSKKVNN